MLSNDFFSFYLPILRSVLESDWPNPIMASEEIKYVSEQV